ncbi:MAG: hypothetical protein AAGE52_35165 [Myxococcota bacterium]
MIDDDEMLSIVLEEAKGGEEVAWCFPNEEARERAAHRIKENEPDATFRDVPGLSVSVYIPGSATIQLFVRGPVR